MADADSEFDAEIHTSGAGASTTFPQQCSKMRKGGYVMIKQYPCKVVEMSTSKTGKHGHAKVHFVGIDIFTGKKYEDICPSTHSVDVPNVQRSELQVIDVDGEGFLSIMDDKGDITQIKCPKETSVEEAQAMVDSCKDDECVQAVIWKAVGTEIVLDMKVAKNK